MPTHVADSNHQLFTFLSGSFTRSPKYLLLAIKGGQLLLRARTKLPPTSTLRPPLQQAGEVLLVGPNSSSSPRPPYQVGARAVLLMHRSSRSSSCPPTTIHQRAMQPGGQGVALACRSKCSSDSLDRNPHQHQHQHHRHLTRPKSGRYAKCHNKSSSSLMIKQMIVITRDLQAEGGGAAGVQGRPATAAVFR
jgi:hypothetical protein